MFPATPPYGHLPLQFEENKGQTGSHARFIARGPHSTAFVTATGLTVALENSAFSMALPGSGAIQGEDPLPGSSSYFEGSRQITGAPHFGSVRAAGILPGIDVLYHAHQSELEFDFIVAPHADPRGIVMRFDGIPQLSLSPKGDLILDGMLGGMRERRPTVWQQIGRRRITVAAHYTIAKNGDVRIALGPYDHSRTLVIDPVLSYSTYLGGSKDDAATAIAVDGNGSAYITGTTLSPDFPTTVGAYRVALNGSHRNVFVSKLNAAGTALVYSTFLGGSAVNTATAIALDAGGNAYVTGSTNSADFPVTKNAFQGALKGQTDAFVSVINAAGTGLVYSTYLGGKAADSATGIAVDKSGNAFVAGTTFSTAFPTTAGAYATSVAKPSPGSNGFLAKLDPTGSKLLYGTYLGGADDDTIAGLAIDAAGNAYVTGTTDSDDFPVTSGAFQKTPASGFVAALNAAGSTLIYSTYLGGSSVGESDEDTPAAIAVDASGNAYVAGTAASADFPLVSAAFTVKTGPRDGFVAKLNPSGSALVYSTYLGGSQSDAIYAIAVDAQGDALVTGATMSPDFPRTAGSFPKVNNGTASTAFLAKLSPAGSSLLYATELGASGISVAAGIAVDGAGNAYLAGGTNSSTFPVTPGAPQTANHEAAAVRSAFVMKINLSDTTACSLSISPGSYAAPVGGGTSSFTVSVQSGCPWEAYNTHKWITLIAPAHGIGSGSVSLTVAPNTGLTAQSANILIGASTFTITQPGGACAQPVLSPASAAIASAGGPSSFTVTLPAGCSYTAQTSTPWISITAGASGKAGGTVSFTVARNDFGSRAGSIRVGNIQFAVLQSAGACTSSLGAASASLPEQGGTGNIAFTASASTCQWTAYPMTPWIKLVTTSGSGSANVGFLAAPNPAPGARTGQVLIGGQTFTVSEAGGAVVAPGSYLITTIAGAGRVSSGPTFGGDGGPADNAILNAPSSVAFDGTGALYIADAQNYRIRKVAADGVIHTVAGNGTNAFSGDGGAGTSASIGFVSFLGTDASNNLYLSDEGNLRVRKLASGAISTVAGSGTSGNTGDGGPAIAATFKYPDGLAVDGSGNLYIADAQASRVRKVSGGTITDFADGLNTPAGLALDTAGNLYIADTVGARVRKVSGGQVTTLTTGNPALSTAPFQPAGIAADALGNVFVSLPYANLIQRIAPDGTVTTIAGGGKPTSGNGDGGLATAATLSSPEGIAIDPFGNIAIADRGNNRVRLLKPVYNFCTLTVDNPSLNADGAGGPMTVKVGGGSGCAWNAASNASWIKVSDGAAGSGNGSVTLSLTANGTASRTGTVSIAAQTVTVTQAPGPATVNAPPALSMATTHVGNFTQGQNGAAFTLAVSNQSGAGSTSGTVTVTETLPSGLTLVAMSGGGWTCATGSNTCTRSDALAGGASYQPIAVSVNVAPNAPAVLINQAGVSGGGSASASSSDSANILAPFTDLTSTDFFFNAVNLMREYGVTAGCSASPPMYCPADNVTRAQMAIFVVRAVLGGDNFSYSSTPHFSDVPATSFGFQWIQKMFELGITAGCGSGNYCPNDAVTRGQMAVWIIRARLGAAADSTFTYPTTPYFTDVPASNIYFKWIQRMKLDSITAGCGTGTAYCPNDLVTRGQMAVLIVRGAFNQLLPNGTPVVGSVSPAVVSRGQTLTVNVSGVNTSFSQGTGVSAGPGITVGAVTVTSSTTLSVQLTVATDAAVGPRTVLAATGNEQAVLPNGLVVE